MINEFIYTINNFAFMQRALIAAILVGIISGAIGVFIILRGLSLMGDAISHAVIPGVAISHMLGINFMIGASFFGILTSFTIGFIAENSRLKKDTTIGIVFTSFFALGLVLISRIRTVTDLNSILFGNVLTVTNYDIRNIFYIGILLFAFIIIFYKELLITSFDEVLAKVYGIKTKLIHYMFLFVLTLVIVSSLRVVGAIMIVSMIITPAATSYLLTNRLPIMIILSMCIGALSSIIGMFFSVTFNLPAGSTIVLVLASFFLVAFLFSSIKKKGKIVKPKKF